MSSTRRTLSIFGVTGSIGQSAADVVASDPARFDVVCVTAQKNVEALAAAAIRLKAAQAVIGRDDLYDDLKGRLAGTGIEAAAGAQALEEASLRPVDIALCAIAGFTGLRPLLNALTHGGIVALANKEPLVAAGPLVMAVAQKHGAMLLPIDSEHNAVFQVFDSERPQGVRKIILTASGGPFRTSTREEMAQASVAQALAHPTWAMGRKISIDSATMMNKALEVIEAHYLFALPKEKIDVLIHPQSVVHAMVEYIDGSVLCQMGASDMRTPIAHVLAWPSRMQTPGRILDFSALSALSFEAVDPEQFPFVPLAYDCLRAGPGACLAMNAANEVAVHYFLAGHIGFLDIMDCVASVLPRAEFKSVSSLEDILEMDQAVRRLTQDTIDSRAFASVTQSRKTVVRS